MLGKFLKNITLSADGLFYALLCIFLMFLLESKRKHRGHDARRVERCLIAITSKQRLKIVSLRTVLNDQLAIHRIYIYIYTQQVRDGIRRISLRILSCNQTYRSTYLPELITNQNYASRTIYNYTVSPMNN